MDFESDIEALKFGMTDYLVHKLKLPKNELYTHPLIFIKNASLTEVRNHQLIAPQFSFEALLQYIRECSYLILSSYKRWSTPAFFPVLDAQIKQLVDQAAKDSITGYLTRKKLDRITKGLMEQRPIFEEQNHYLISIEGKAGTGKTSELLLLMQKNIQQGKNTLYLTYNKLLVNDIARTVVSYLNSLVKNKERKNGTHSVTTLHKFFYHLSKRLGVLHVMSAERIEELTKQLKERTNQAFVFIRKTVQAQQLQHFDPPNLLLLKEHIQNTNELDITQKQVSIDLVNYLSKRGSYETHQLKKVAIDFVAFKTRLLEKISIDDMFLRDYYEVLKNTLLAINTPKAYYDKFEIDDKYELLMAELALKDKHQTKDEDDELIMNEPEFLKTLRRKIGGVRMRRTVYLDEAQDCHALEREIVFSIFHYKNLVIANGGREQLIRHAELCNWAVFNNRKLSIRPNPAKPRTQLSGVIDLSEALLFPPDKLASILNSSSNPPADGITYDMVIYKNTNKSYRIKKALLDFCNYVAEQCGLNLNLSALDSDDTGELIFDFRGTEKNELLLNEFTELLRKGTLNGCTEYESLMLLIDADARIDRTSDGDGHQAEKHEQLTEGTINEFDNIDDSLIIKRKEWEHKKTLEANFQFWDGATNDKGRLMIPSPNECRLLFYESCRGLEAWSVACFNIDNFFDQKFNDPQAEKFLLNEEREKGIQQLHISNDQRRKMYAGTWILMALTRPIDTLYLSFKNPNAEFTQLARKYLETTPRNTKMM